MVGRNVVGYRCEVVTPSKSFLVTELMPDGTLHEVRGAAPLHRPPTIRAAVHCRSGKRPSGSAGRGEPSPNVQMWQGRVQSRRRCGRG